MLLKTEKKKEKLFHLHRLVNKIHWQKWVVHVISQGKQSCDSLSPDFDQTTSDKRFQ